ncbi:MAG: type IV secretory pathway VirB4 component [Candidatus Midichloriaceae bacterium]
MSIDEFNDLTIKTNYKNFFHSKFYSNFFEKDNVKILNDTQYLNVDFSKIYNNPKLFKPFFSLVVNNIVNSLNGDKTIIVINNAQSFFDGYGFNGKISKILKDIGKKNAILILIQENFEEEELPDTFENEVANFATRLFLSDRMIDKKYKYLYNLSDQEFNYIKSYDSKKRRFLLKYREDSVFAEVNLDGFGDILKLLG